VARERYAEVFLRTLAELVASGQVFLARRTTDTPATVPEELARHGTKVGWVDEDGVYLLPGVGFAAVDRATRGGFPLTERALWKMLAEDGHLAARDAGHFTTKARCAGAVRRVLRLKPGALPTVNQQAHFTLLPNCLSGC
jgi:hypothetical protein